jgi:hypothetical protein
MEWNPTNFALWSEMDDALPHFIAYHDVRFQSFWEHFPDRGRVVFTPEPDDARTSVSIWLDAPVDEDAWAAAANRLPPLSARSPRLFSKAPDIELGGTGVPPPLAMWRRHPAVDRVKLYYHPGVEALEGLWHIAGGSELWECDIWLKPSQPGRGLVPFGHFLSRRLKSRK